MNKIKALLLKYKNLPFNKRTDLNNKCTLILNLIWACLKLVFAYFIKSVFISLSAFYTIFIALSKTAYFDGKRNRTTVYSERKYVKRIAFGLILAGLSYLAYFSELFLRPQEKSYDLIFSITLATIAFCEVTFSIIGIFKSKKTKDLLLTSLKFINLSSALSSIVSYTNSPAFIATFFKRLCNLQHNYRYDCWFGNYNYCNLFNHCRQIFMDKIKINIKKRT